MVPACYPSKISSTTGLREAVVFALSSVTGLVRWSDYIPVKLVASADAALEGRTDAGGFIPMDMLSSNTGLMGWVDYLPVYVDNSATDAWAITATGFIPYAPSGGISLPAFTVTMTALSNALGTVTTLAYINPGSGGGSGGTITPSVTVSRTSGKEMLAVYFDASGTTASTTSNPEHELFYAWDFGDERGQTWAYGTNTAQSKNNAFGPQAAHVYTTAGTFTPTCVILDGSGNSTTWTGASVTVSAWTEAETVYISNGSTPTAGVNGVGSGAAGYYNETTWAGVKSRFASNRRVRLSNASTWSCTSQAALASITGMQIDGYGTGTKPALDDSIASTYTSLFTTNSACSDIRICDVKVTGTIADQVGAVAFGGNPGSNILFHNIEITLGVEGINSSNCDGLFVVGCNIHDIGVNNTSGLNGTFYYGMFPENVNRMALIGTAIDNVFTGHGIRVGGVNRGVFANSTVRKARRGYGGGGGHAMTLRGWTNEADRPTWNGIWSEKLLVCDNVIGDFDEGIDSLQVASQNGGDAARHRNVIVERNFIKSHLNTCIITEVSDNMTIRSNICTTDGAAYAIEVVYNSTVSAPQPVNTKIYNNTVWKTTNASYNGFSAIYCTSNTSGTLIANNLGYAPADTRDGLTNGSAPTFICGSGSYSLVGGNSTDSQVKNTKPWASTSPSAYADYSPNSYGINGGVAVPVMKDFFNATITGSREIGAIQV